jgi:hypothetical protein
LTNGQLSKAGRAGATGFWRRYRSEPDFRERMNAGWKKQSYNREQKRSAAKLGAAALWQRYYSDSAFRKAMDKKLRASRSRGGAKSIFGMSQRVFKERLAASALSRALPAYHDLKGNLLRSSLELRVARSLYQRHLQYVVEPRVVVPGHAFYPDFGLAGGRKFVEVVGYAADWYWDKTADKIRLIVENYASVEVAVITPFLKIMVRRMKSVPRVALFSTYQLEELIQWCRGNAGVHRKVTDGRVVNARATCSGCQAGPQLEIDDQSARDPLGLVGSNPTPGATLGGAPRERTCLTV